MRASKERTWPTLAEAINEHQYPRLLHASPLALRAYHAAVHLTTLRSWYVRRALRRLEDRLGVGATVLDVGCGSGDHLYYVMRRRPDLRAIGIDRSKEAVELCRAHAVGVGAIGAEFRRRDVDAGDPLPRSDLTLCITMLQYVGHDQAMVTAMRRGLERDGLLVLYVPVRNERLWSFYDRLVEGGELDYDAVQGRRRVYQPDRVRALIDAAGLEIVSEEFSYGKPGKAAFELHALLVHGMSRPGVVAKSLAGIGVLVLLPLVLALMLADYLSTVTRGNGMLVVARRGGG